jgi:sugar lactone lactonase YvrE
MSAPEIAVAANTGDMLGESPSWLARERCLYWVDLRAPALHRLDPARGAVRSWPMPDLIGAVVGRGGGASWWRCAMRCTASIRKPGR